MRDLRQRGRVGTLQHVGERRVEVASTRPGDVAVERVAHERMGESDPPTLDPCEDAGALRGKDGMDDLLALSSRDADDGGLVGLDPDDGSDVEDLERPAVEHTKPLANDLPHAERDGQRTAERFRGSRLEQS